MNEKLTVKPLPYPTRKRSIFKTLLWAEGAPRHPALRFIVLFLILYATPSLAILLEAIIPDFESSVPNFSDQFDQAKYLALTGVLCGLFGHGCRGLTARPVWQSMALPVTTRRLALTAIYYQARLALLLGTLWGLSRLSSGLDDPIGHALRMTLLLSAQGQAALLWLSAAGAIQGLVAFTVGLAAAGCAGIIASYVGPFSPVNNMAVVLVTGAWGCSYAAVRAMRGGPIPHVELPELPGVAPLRNWHLARTMGKRQFTSPFWAQVWFEWQRTARWFPIAIAVTLVLTLCVDVPHILSTGRAYFDLEKDGGDTILNPYGAVTLLIPLLFWYLHITITRPYRNFVFTQPNTVQRVGRAKLFAALFAAAVIAVISGLKVWIYTELLPTEAVDSASASGFFLWNALLAQATAASVAFLCLVYGPSLFMPGMLQLFQFILSRFLSGDPLPEHVEQSVRVFDLLFLVIPLLVTAILFSSIAGTFALRQWKHADYPFPWELTAALVVTV
ncbi:MAG: hypothetical protein L3K26_02965, partial [Candidatus Hydrogenedentes bacterium]|nr:hypothetical protein [Candidatus Hydrogenedentota bacterium]